ncbi:MAG: NACHT domain-containing protein, partial [Caldilineaceae bacterium]|nr:NACHT domain-containing protein [Caldilineaceae bacterium]
MSRYTLTLLGAFHLAVDEAAPNELPANKAGALLAYLALESATHQERGQSRRQLASLFWPDIDEKYALQSLRNTLYNLRQFLQKATPATDDRLLTATRQSVCLEGQIEVDALRFQALLAEVAQHPHVELNHCAHCEERLVAALKLYGGELLTGLSLEDAPAFEEWLLLWREFLHQQAVVATSQLVEIYEAWGALGEAHGYASKLVALDAFREESHRALMRILAGQGLPERALSHFERLRQLLREELNDRPAPETVALAQQIAAGEFVAQNREQRLDASTPVWDIKPVEQQADPTDAPAKRPLAFTNEALADSSGHEATPPHRQSGPLPSSPVRDVPEPGLFFGRTRERRQLRQWLLHDRVRVVAILGIGGMGKTTLAARSVRELAGEWEGDRFDVVLWRSLVNAPPLTELLPPLLQLLSDQQLSSVPASLDEQLRLLVGYLRKQRVLLVLDNLESILEPAHAGAFRPGYEPYAQLIERTATLDHKSHLLLTSRERPRGYNRLERDSPLVQSLHLTGLDDTAGNELLMQRGLSGGGADEALLIKRYSGNPLALKLVADTIDEIFGGDIGEFLSEETLVFDDIRTVLNQQFGRLDELEVELLFWLTIEREPTAISTLRQNLLRRQSQKGLIDALRNLERRSLLARHNDGFALQNVIIEYLTDRLVEQVCQEIVAGQLNLLMRHSLLKAQAKEYVRQSQVRLIVAPIARALVTVLGRPALAEKLQTLLRSLSAQEISLSSYAAGNLLNLLVHLAIDMRGFDFSQLTLRETYLQGAILVDTNFAAVKFANTVFTDSFGTSSWIAISSDDQLMAVAFDSGEIGLWRLPNVQPERIWLGHERRVRWVAFSPDNQSLVSASLDQTVRVWDLRTGHCLRTFRAHQKGLHTAAFSPDGRYIASGGQDHLICLWNVKSGQLLATLRGHSDWINALAFHPNGQLLASASHDNTIRLWNVRVVDEQTPLADDPLIGTLDGQFRVVSLAFSPDGALLASGGGDSTVRLWDVENQRAMHTLRRHTGWVRGVAFSPDGSRLASGGTDQLIRVWSVPDGNMVDVLHGHTAEISSLSFTADGKMLVSIAGQEINLWDLSNPHQGQAIRSLRGSVIPINCVQFSPDGGLIASGNKQGALHLWRVADDGASALFHRALPGHTDIITGLAFSPDGTLLASASHDGSIRLWDAEGGTCLDLLWHSGKSKINCVAFTPSGSTLISAGAEGTIHLWRRNDKGGWTLDHILSVPTHVIHTLTISADGRLLAHGTADRSVYVWDLASKQQIHCFEGFSQDFWTLLFVPNTAAADQMSTHAELLAGGNRSGVIHLWDFEADHPAQPTRTINAHSGVLRGLAFSPASGYLASSGEDHTVKVWELHSGKELHTLKGHRETIISIDLRCDGRILVSGGADGVIKLWDAQVGTCLSTLHIPRPYEGMN